jgi:ABC-type branched-subunit amino acid transport system substrate-binding protein
LLKEREKKKWRRSPSLQACRVNESAYNFFFYFLLPKVKQMKKVSTLAIPLGLLVTLVLSGWAAPSLGQAEALAPPIKIGCLLPFTGALMTQGPHVRDGIQLALEHYGNEVAGRKIELIIEDDGTDPTTALDKARKLVERDKVAIIIGPQAGHVVQAVQPYLTERKIICLKSRQFPMPLTAKFPYLFVVDGKL